MPDEKHVKDTDLLGDHHTVSKSTEGGKCIWGGIANYEQNSCSYRYQAKEKALEAAEKEIYHSYKDKLEAGEIDDEIPTLAWPTDGKSGPSMNPQRYLFKLSKPEDGEWDVDGPKKTVKRSTDDPKFTKKDTIKKGHNFRKERWPYWNQAHHLIPKASFLNKIAELTESKPPTYPVIIKKAFLEAKYNINHKINMMFLPMDKEVGKIISLPRHITLSLTDGPDQKPEFGNHKIYNDQVEDELEKIVNSCIKKIDDAVEEGGHPELQADFAKDDLETLSKDLRKLIKKFGKEGSSGLPIASMDIASAF